MANRASSSAWSCWPLESTKPSAIVGNATAGVTTLLTLRRLRVRRRLHVGQRTQRLLLRQPRQVLLRQDRQERHLPLWRALRMLFLTTILRMRRQRSNECHCVIRLTLTTAIYFINSTTKTKTNKCEGSEADVRAQRRRTIIVDVGAQRRLSTPSSPGCVAYEHQPGGEQSPKKQNGLFAKLPHGRGRAMRDAAGYAVRRCEVRGLQGTGTQWWQHCSPFAAFAVHVVVDVAVESVDSCFAKTDRTDSRRGTG